MNTIYVQSVDDEEKWSPTVYKPRFKWLTRCLVTCKRSTDTTNYFIDKKKTMVINFFWMHLLSSWHQTERFRPKCGHKYHNTCTSSHTKFTLWQSWHLPKACKSVFVLRHTSIQKIHHEKWCLFKFALKFNRFEPNEIVVIKRFVYFRKWNTWNKFVSRSMNSNDKLKINDKLM